MKRTRRWFALCALVATLGAPSPAAPAQWTAAEESRLDEVAPATDDERGLAVALDGHTAIVGAPGDDTPAGADAGSAAIFVRNGTAWSRVATLAASDATGGDRFGASVAISGDTALVGAPEETQGGPSAGAAYVFVRQGTQWVQQQKLTASDSGPNDSFGYSVGLDADRALVGASTDRVGGFPDAGSGYVFERSGSSWGETQKLVTTNPMPGFLVGYSGDVSGDVVVLGARGGLRVYVFELLGGTWIETARLTAPALAHAQGIGRSASVSGRTIVLGAPNDDLVNPLASNAGSAYVFTFDGTDWGQEQKLKASDAQSEERFGRSVSVSGDLIVVGAYLGDTPAGVDTGSAYLFSRSGTVWTEQDKLAASDAATGADFGWSCAVSGALAIVGAPLADGMAAAQTGAAYAYAFAPPAPVSYCTAGTSSSGCKALLSASGNPSATAPTGFDLSAFSVEGDKDGLFFFGANGRQANPWGNGGSYQCVVTPVSRGGLLTGAGTSGGCDGAFAQDLNARWTAVPNQNPGAGSVVQAQLWYRDPFNTSNQTTGLSDAIEFAVGP